MAKTRADFPDSVARAIAQAAMYICAAPHCLRFTGYGTEEGKPRAIAEAAHIAAASKRGPRADDKASKTQLRSASNGIWMCKICHTMIDDDPGSYPATLLKEWKTAHAKLIRGIVGKDLEAAILNLGNHKRYKQEAKEALSFLDNKRLWYEAMDHERPRLVKDSLDIIRERLIQTRAKTNPDSDVHIGMNKLQMAIDQFYRDIGDADMNTLRCDHSNPLWKAFEAALLKLRDRATIIVRVIAGNAWQCRLQAVLYGVNRTCRLPTLRSR